MKRTETTATENVCTIDDETKFSYWVCGECAMETMRSLHYRPAYCCFCGAHFVSFKEEEIEVAEWR